MRRTRGRRLAGLVAIAVLGLSATECSAGGAQPAGTSVLRIPAPNDAGSWDPAAHGASDLPTLGFFQAVFAMLTTIEPDQSIGPGLATSWSYDAPKTTLTMNLRSGVSFTDGTAFDASVVKQNLDRDLAAKGQAAISLAAIGQVSVASQYQVVIKLNTPDPALLYTFGLIPGAMISPRSFTAAATAPVGCGPYVLDAGQTTRGSTYVFTRNPKYNLPQKFGFDTVQYKVITDTNAQVTALASHQVDTGGVTAPGLASVKSAGMSATGVSGLIVAMFIVDRAGTTNPALAKPQVRQALNYGLNATALLDSIGGKSGSRTTQMFAAGTPAYDASLNSRYPYDPAKARQLLAEAGYPHGFTLQLPSENTYLPALYPIVSQQLAQIGVRVKYTPVSADQITAQYLSGKFPAFMFTYTATQNWLDVQSLLARTAPFNPFHVDDPTVSQLAGQIAVAGADQQATLLKQLNTYIVDQGWFAPLYVNTSYLVWDPRKVSISLAKSQEFAYLYQYQPAR
ncbi:MAG TPA: ABC transporter substrate-binding protein [Rugosimonospora sp.]